MLNTRLPGVVAVVLTAFVLTGCQKTPEAKLEQTQEKMLAQIKVEGFTRVRLSTEDSAARGIYVGAPVDDVQSRISGGGVSLGPAQFGPISKAEEGLYDGTGTAPNGQACSLSVDRLRSGESPFDNWGLSKGQAADVKAGKQQVLIINVTCGTG